MWPDGGMMTSNIITFRPDTPMPGYEPDSKLVCNKPDN